MNFMRKIPAAILFVFLLMPCKGWSQKTSTKAEAKVMLGTVVKANASGTQLTIEDSVGTLHQIALTSEMKIDFVGLPKTRSSSSRVGLAAKVVYGEGQQVKTISFTPAVGQASMLGGERLGMSPAELFGETDQDSSRTISYLEFSHYIYYSQKHGPDAYRKADRDRSGNLDLNEFVEALKSVSWWKLSRKTPEDWFLQADQNQNESLDIKEFAQICTSGNHIENIFKRTDQDGSGALNLQETTSYIRSVTHEKKKTRKKRKSNG